MLTIGSCFSENIGKKLLGARMEVVRNPFGTLFHPLAIEKVLSLAESSSSLCDLDFIQDSGIWHCWHTHSQMSHPELSVVQAKINSQIEETNNRIKAASHIFITYGTAWIYRHKPTDLLVANCHKIAASSFEKSLLSIEQIVESISRTYQIIKKLNPKSVVVFSISPVRHLKDGFVENQRSKAHLITALHSFLENQKSHNLFYFPAYELLMDELRDYRFYDSDMVHPNQLAIEIIWERFKDCFFDAKTLVILQKVEAIQKDLQHRPFHPDSLAHTKFLHQLHKKIAALQKEYPQINFEELTPSD